MQHVRRIRVLCARAFSCTDRLRLRFFRQRFARCLLASVCAGLLIFSFSALVGCADGGSSSGGESTLQNGRGDGSALLPADSSPAQTGASVRAANANVADQAIDYQETTFTQRDYYCDTASARTATILVYLCGADLESEYGAATSDLNEILYGSFGNNVNVIVETGGASSWNNSEIKADTNCYYEATPDGLELLKDVGRQDMTDPATLQSFVEYGTEAYPADRTMLVMWDHGGGTLGGFGVDERFPQSECMSITEIRDALTGAGAHFDAIGFDACLMATAETACALEGCADYLIASQRTEPASGWDYKTWIGELSRNPSMSTPQLGQLIVDGFVRAATEEDPTVDATLSVMDLTKLPELMDAMGAFFSQSHAALTADDFPEFSQARAKTVAGRSDDTEYDLVDLSYLAQNLSSTASAEALQQAIDACIVYDGANLGGNAANGMNVYFPYSDISQYPAMANVYAELGFEKDYYEFLSAFVTIMASGQTQEAASFQSDENLSVNWNSYSWFDDALAAESSAFASGGTIAGDSLEVVEKNGGWVLSLPEEDWDKITTIEQVVLFDDGEGYIDLGADNVYEFDDEGDLLVEFDNTWVALDGETVCFTFAAENYETDDWYTYGTVPALINGQVGTIVVQWDAQHEDGIVLGYQREAASLLASRGPVAFQEGDTVQYACDYYQYDGSFDGTYKWGDPFTYQKPFTVSYEDIGLGDCVVVYRLTDLYGNQYETEPVSFTD